MYVKNFFDGVSKKASQELTENIRQEMSLEIADLDWMDDKTRYLGWLREVELTIFLYVCTKYNIALQLSLFVNESWN